MRTQSRDTSPEIERILIRGHQAFSPTTRFGRVRSMTYLLAEANRHQTAEADDAAQVVAFLRSQYGPAFAEAWNASVPSPSGIAIDLLATLERLAHVLTQHHVRFALTGSLACCLYGFPRTCHDIDLLIDAGEENLLDESASPFIRVGLPSPDSPLLASWLDPHTLIKVDRLMAAPPFPLDHLLARAQEVTLTEQGFLFPVLTPEDVLLTRLQWYATTGCQADDQWNDLMGLVKLQSPTLDATYLSAQARHHQLTALFQQLCDDTEFEGIMNEPTHEFAGCPADDAARH